MGYSTLKAALDAVVKTNGRQEITGSNLNGVMTTLLQGVDVLDRANPADTSGMNHVVLKKNMTFAEQVTGQNTIYEIRDTFNLSNATISIPSGCVLVFNGGKLQNGTLNMNECPIVSDDVQIFDNVILQGKSVVRASWFGVSTANNDNSPYLQLACMGTSTNDRKSIYFGVGVFNFATSVNIGFCSLYGAMSISQMDKAEDVNSRTELFYTGTGGFLVIGQDPAPTSGYGLEFKNLYINTTQPSSAPNWDNDNTGVLCEGNLSFRFENVTIRKFGVGLNVGCTISCVLSNSRVQACGIGVKIGGNNLSTTISIVNSYLTGNGTHVHLTNLLDFAAFNTIFESSYTENLVVDPRIRRFALIGCYFENNNYGVASQSTKTYEIRLIDTDDNNNKLTGEYHPVISTYGCRFAPSNSTYPRYVIYLPVGHYSSVADSLVGYKYLVFVDDLRSVNSANYVTTNIDSPDVAQVIDPNSIITTFSAQHLKYAKTESGNYKFYFPKDFSVGERLLQDTKDTTGNRTALRLNNRLWATSDGVVMIGANRRLGSLEDTTAGVADALSLPVRASAKLPNLAGSEQVFINCFADNGVPYLSEMLTLSSGFPGYGAWKSYAILTAMNGTTANRPTISSSFLKGFQYFDTDLGKPIWWNGTAWVDATGTAV